MQSQLPDEIWVNALLRLDWQTYLPLRLVSRKMNSLVLKTIRCEQSFKCTNDLEKNYKWKQIFNEPFQWFSLRQIEVDFRKCDDLQFLPPYLMRTLQKVTIEIPLHLKFHFQNFLSLHSQLTELNIKFRKSRSDLYTSGKFSFIFKMFNQYIAGNE